MSNSPAETEIPSFNLWVEDWLPLEMPNGNLKSTALAKHYFMPMSAA